MTHMHDTVLVPPHLRMPETGAVQSDEDDMQGAVFKSCLHPDTLQAAQQYMLPSEQWCGSHHSDEFIVQWLHPDTLEPVLVPEEVCIAREPMSMLCNANYAIQRLA
jgi:hypothetical protein